MAAVSPLRPSLGGAGRTGGRTGAAFTRVAFRMPFRSAPTTSYSMAGGRGAAPTPRRTRAVLKLRWSTTRSVWGRPYSIGRIWAASARRIPSGMPARL